jgi:hypothetical protein
MDRISVKEISDADFQLLYKSPDLMIFRRNSKQESRPELE